MAEDNTTGLGNVIRIDDQRIQDQLGKIVRGSLEETLNALLGAGRGLFQSAPDKLR